jgi:autotransporter-associated beta strand protein
LDSIKTTIGFFAPNPEFLKIFRVCLLITGLVMSPLAVHSATVTWDGGGTDANWTTANNWSNNAPWRPADDAVFASSFASGTSIQLNGNKTVNSLSITSGTDFSLNGNTLTLTSGDITRSATNGTTNIQSAVVLGGAAAWDISGNLTASGIVSGAFGLTKSGSGVLTLTNANTYTGATTITAGIVNIRNSAALGATSGDTIINTGGELQLQGGITVGAGETLTLTGIGAGGADSAALRNISGNNTWTDTITLQNVAGAVRVNSDSGTLTLGAINETGNRDKILTIGGAGDVVVTGVITGSGNDTSIFKGGTGTLRLSGSNTYTGLTTISAGTLIAANNSALGTTASGTVLTNGATLGLQGGINIASEALNITGILRSISDNNTYGGQIILTGASSILSDSGTFAVNSAGPIGGAFNLTIGGAGNLSISAIIGIGTGTLTKTGSGTTTLGGTAANTFSGTVFANEGTLILGNTVINGNIPGSLVVGDGIGIDTVRLASSGQIGNNSSVTINSSGVLLYDSSVLDTIGTLTMTGGSVVTGTGRMFLSGDLTSNANADSATISGNLNLNANGNTNPTAVRTVTVADGAAAQDMVISAVISDGSLTKAGAGVLNLGAANLYTGITNINEGTLLVTNTSGSGTGTGVVNVSANATLGGTGTISGNVTISGIHSPGVSNIATQNFGSSLAYAAGSILSWDLDSPLNDAGLNAINQGSYDKIVANSLIGLGSIFRILLDTGNSFSDAFWNSDKTWNNIVTTNTGTPNLAAVFSGGFAGDVASNGTVSGRGRFSFVGNNLVWTAVPEPSSLLYGLLAAAMMLVRRRHPNG